jgi:hypothetical protein
MRNDADFMHHIPDVIGDPHRLVGWIEPTLQPGIVGGDTSWTGIPVALLGLDTTQRQQPGR